MSISNMFDSEMSDRDRDNLNFLLSSSNEVLRDWMSVTDQDDIDYAFDLLTRAKLMMIDQAVEFSDLREANNLLSGIMKNPKS